MDSTANNGETSKSPATVTPNIRAKTGEKDDLQKVSSPNKFHVGKPVPVDVLTKCLSLALHTPSKIFNHGG